MKRTALAALTLAIAAVTGSAHAQDRQHDNFNYNNVRADHARVIEVKRVGGRYSTRLSQECWDERTNRHESGYYRDNSGRLYRGDNSSNKAGTIVGAIIGGALGNQVGSGSGRTAATVAGAVIGGSIGSKSDRDNDRDRYDYDGYEHYRSNDGVVRRCRTVSEPAGSYGRRGYEVTYEYAGQSYQAFTTVRPGRTIPVLVDVRAR